MKNRLNLTVNNDLIQKMKKYADLRHTSLSQIVEEHFEELLNRPTRLHEDKSLLEYVKTLPKSKVDYPKDFDFNEEYYKAKNKESNEQNPV